MTLLDQVIRLPGTQLYTKVKPGLKAFCPRCTKLNEPGCLCECGCREAIVVDEESWNEKTH